MGFARNVQFNVKAGQVDEFSRLMKTEILPLMKTQKGFREDVTLLKKDAGMSLSLWDDRMCAETYHTTTFPTVLKKLGPVIEGNPRVDTYDSVVAELRV